MSRVPSGTFSIVELFPDGQWTVTDEGGGQTTVVLGPLATGKSYSTDTFSINAEAGKHKRPDK